MAGRRRTWWSVEDEMSGNRATLENKETIQGTGTSAAWTRDAAADNKSDCPRPRGGRSAGTRE